MLDGDDDDSAVEDDAGCGLDDEALRESADIAMGLLTRKNERKASCAPRPPGRVGMTEDLT